MYTLTIESGDRVFIICLSNYILRISCLGYLIILQISYYVSNLVDYLLEKF